MSQSEILVNFPHLELPHLAFVKIYEVGSGMKPF
ncbi:hypothetical protein RUA8715_03484 [Ruegeria arenilitoris]|uniref:Uncharacterized protein n=1 Tax=Ruegeria arenilitoris TaxID=1173585 RepID=A0A238L0H1_9RHOB|nr:hypothetical protein RUA8715_03484 [Ruegeria arenilitoris]